MNSVHDLGGMDGFGAIDAEPNEPVFHEPWEKQVFGLMYACFGAGQFNVDEFRHGIERMGNTEYLQSSYYEHWLAALETLLIEKGVLSREELAARKAEIATGADQ